MPKRVLSKPEKQFWCHPDSLVPLRTCKKASWNISFQKSTQCNDIESPMIRKPNIESTSSCLQDKVWEGAKVFVTQPGFHWCSAGLCHSLRTSDWMPGRPQPLPGRGWGGGKGRRPPPPATSFYLLELTPCLWNLSSFSGADFWWIASLAAESKTTLPAGHKKITG